MNTVYLVCAAAGGTLMVCQFLLSLLGFGGHHDMGDHDVHDVGGHDVHAGDHEAGDHDATHDAHHESHHETQRDSAMSWFMGMLTFRTIVAALLFFGLAGLAASESEWDEVPAFLVAVGAGAAALFLVGSMMRSLSKFKAEGTVRMERAIGRNGTVYLPIPGEKTGIGKVMLNLQNRTVECQAVTAQQQALPTGAPVVVVAVLSSDTVVVAPVPDTGSMNHV
jgi:hypothetical protein